MSEASPLEGAQRLFASAVPFRAVSEETCHLAEALGRTVYRDVIAPSDMPPYHRAIVEGFLVHTQDTAAATEEAPVSFSVVGAVRPGDEHCPPIKQGEAVEVVTGVVVPDGDYSILRMWEVKRDGGRVSISRPFPPRFFIEDRAGDFHKGAVVVAAGKLLGAAEIGTVAALGVTRLSMAQRPRVTVFSCGDEVIPYDQEMQPGLIRDSNSVMLCAAVTAAGGEAHNAGILRDDLDAVIAAARAALDNSDMLVISGGTAAGGGDFISTVVKSLGDLLVDGVPMRSGRPLIMGVAAGKPVVCVAGHPPEALRGFRLFGVAALNRLLGRDAPLPEDAS
ncbi:MAG: molybdopterin molybdotransferase MoeA [Gammaproteobacteria bacterium]|jgi:molybdenum cofactor synthesis domain-containing protein